MMMRNEDITMLVEIADDLGESFISNCWCAMRTTSQLNDRYASWYSKLKWNVPLQPIVFSIFIVTLRRWTAFKNATVSIIPIDSKIHRTTQALGRIDGGGSRQGNSCSTTWLVVSEQNCLTVVLPSSSEIFHFPFSQYLKRRNATAKILLGARLFKYNRRHQTWTRSLSFSLLLKMQCRATLSLPCSGHIHHQKRDPDKICFMVQCDWATLSGILHQRLLQTFFLRVNTAVLHFVSKSVTYISNNRCPSRQNPNPDVVRPVWEKHIKDKLSGSSASKKLSFQALVTLPIMQQPLQQQQRIMG